GRRAASSRGAPARATGAAQACPAGAAADRRAAAAAIQRAVPTGRLLCLRQHGPGVVLRGGRTMQDLLPVRPLGAVLELRRRVPGAARSPGLRRPDLPVPGW